MEVTRRRNRSQKPFSAIFLKNYAWNINHTYDITANANCVTTLIQKLRGHGQTRLPYLRYREPCPPLLTVSYRPRKRLK